MNKLWSKIRGFKTITGGVLHAAWFVYYVFIEEVETDTKYVGHSVIFILTGVGIGDKIYRNKETINNSINKTLNVFKKK